VGPAREQHDRLAVRSALGELHLVHTKLVVNRRTLRLLLYDHGHEVFQARVGVGKQSTPTPAGSFWVCERFRVAGSPLYGAQSMGTAADSTTLTDWPGGGILGPSRHVRARSHTGPSLARLRPVEEPGHRAPSTRPRRSGRLLIK
jgi:hypothetical protein